MTAALLNWDDFRVFLAVARSCAVLGAATELGVTPSTVARRVSALEEAIEARLQTGYESAIDRSVALTIALATFLEQQSACSKEVAPTLSQI